MAVALAALDEGAAVLVIALRAVELTALAVAGRSVPLEVAEMRAGRAAAEFVPDDPRLDHDPPLSLGRGSAPRACRFSRSAAAWPRPIREHLPFLGAPPRRLPPLSRDGVSGPPFAFAAAFITWATNDCERRALR